MPSRGWRSSASHDRDPSSSIERPDRAAGAGRVLEQEPRRVGAELEHLAQSGHAALHARLEARAEVRADVEDDAVCLDRARGSHVERIVVDALAVDRLVGARQVAEVERVDEHRADARFLAPLAEAGEILFRMLGEAPHARALREELYGVGADLDSAVEGALDPA